MEEAAGLLTRGSLSHRLPGCRSPGAPVAFRRASNSPHSGGTVPDSHRVPSPRSLVTAEPIIGRCRQQLSGPGRRSSLWAAVIFAFSSIPSLVTGARHLGSRPAQARAPDRVRRARGAPRCGRSPGRGSRSSPAASTPRPTRSTSTSSAAATAPGTTSLIDTVGVTIGVARLEAVAVEHDDRAPDRPRRRARRHASRSGTTGWPELPPRCSASTRRRCRPTEVPRQRSSTRRAPATGASCSSASPPSGRPSTCDRTPRRAPPCAGSLRPAARSASSPTLPPSSRAIALAQLGAARRIAALETGAGALERLAAVLGADATRRPDARPSSSPPAG